MKDHVYFHCVPLKATITTNCCDKRQEIAKKAKKGNGLTDEAAIYRACIKCAKSGMPPVYQKNTVPSAEVEDMVLSMPHPENRKNDLVTGAATYHEKNLRIYDRSYNPFR